MDVNKMNAWTVFGLGWLGLVVIFTAVWAVQLKTRNAGIVDAVWAWTLGALGPWFALNSTAPIEVRWLIGIMPLVWGLRLGTYLWFRNHGHAEDGRYAQLRKEWGESQNLRMWTFFQVQVVFSMLIALGLAVAAQRSDAPAPLWLWLSVVLWVVSIAGEALADRQLAAFKANPANKGRVCKQGLWKYSRHPNYFFECVHWVAYVPLALGAPWGFLSLIPPAVMAFLLLKMSGIPATEAQAARTRPEYAEYIRTTSAFIPWFPKS
ncbi:DUF1295 domain-containing protein [Limnobacter humi]|uniref:DUF1295 domain-containing protein n=1 Tax=Limnobacter humi TaxID=1778671 RepID=A0ABT1WHH5_9BURK|nr:DUF1295 domain-containing protein [Limnobacter humi]MCQ8896318.1 DUF1295 domain-containing protein [Limnobacter humi]